MNSKLLIGLLVVGVVLVIGIILFNYTQEITPPMMPPKSLVKWPIEIDLSVSPFSTDTEKIAELTTTIKTLDFEAENFSIRVNIPRGFKVISGDVFWQGDIPKNGSIQFTTIIKAVEDGDWVINTSQSFGMGDIFYISTCNDVVTVSDTLENNWQSKWAIPLGGESEEIQGDLFLSSLPLLNKKVDLVFEVTSSEDISTGIVLLIPQKGMDVVELKPASIPTTKKTEFTDSSGYELFRNGKQISWKGNIARGETFKIEAVVKSTEIGKGTIIGTVKGKTVLLHVSVGRCSASVTKEYPIAPEVPPTPPSNFSGISPEPVQPERQKDCTQLIIDQIYDKHQPHYCVGMPPCQPASVQEVKEMIDVIISDSTFKFSFMDGKLCGIDTFYGEGMIDLSCNIKEIRITNKTSESIPC